MAAWNKSLYLNPNSDEALMQQLGLSQPAQVDFLASLLPAQAPAPQAKVTKKVTPRGWSGLSKAPQSSLNKILASEPSAQPEPTSSVVVAPPEAQPVQNYVGEALPETDSFKSHMARVAAQNAAAKQFQEENKPGAQPVGGHEGVKSGIDSTFKSMVTQNIPLTAAQIQEIHDAVAAQPEVRALELRNQKLRELADQYEKMPMEKPEANLSGALALGDFLMGGKTNLGAGYKAPKSAAEIQRDRYKELLSIQDKLAENQRDLAKSVIAAYPGLVKAGGTQVDMSQLLSKMGLESAMGNKQQTQRASAAEQNAARNFTKDTEKDVKDERDMLAAASNARQLLKQGSTIADSMLVRMMLRLSKESRFTDQDVAQFKGDSRIVNKLQQAWASLVSTGTMTPLNREENKVLIDNMEAWARNNLARKRQARIDTASSIYPGLTTDKASSIATKLYADPSQPEAPRKSAMDRIMSGEEK